jgi:hypothetical protein
MSSSWSQALVKISPYTFSAVGIAVAIGVSVLGAAWYHSDLVIFMCAKHLFFNYYYYYVI